MKKFPFQGVEFITKIFTWNSFHFPPVISFSIILISVFPLPRTFCWAVDFSASEKWQEVDGAFNRLSARRKEIST